MTETIESSIDSNKLDFLNHIIYNSCLIHGFSNSGNDSKAVITYNKSKEMIDNKIEGIINQNDDYWFFYSIVLVAIFSIKQKEYSVALKYLNSSINYFKKFDKQNYSELRILAWINLYIGQIYRQTAKIDQAVNHFQTTINYCKTAENVEYARSAFINLSLLYEGEGKEDLAIETANDFIQSVSINFNNDSYSLSSANNLLGNIYSRLGEVDLAKAYYSKAFTAITDFNILQKIKCYYFNNMGVVSHKIGEYVQAIDFYHKAIESANQKDLIYFYPNLGEAYLALGKEYLDEALHYELETLNILNTFQNDDMLCETYFNLVKIHLEKNDFDKASYYSDKIHNMSISSHNQVFKVKYELALALTMKYNNQNKPAIQKLLKILEIQNLAFDLKTIALTELLSIEFLENKSYDSLNLTAQKLAELGKNKNSLPVSSNLAIFLSRLKLLSLDFDAAEETLKDSLDLCIQKKSIHCRKKIEGELESLSLIKSNMTENPQNSHELLQKRMGNKKFVHNVENLQRLILANSR